MQRRTALRSMALSLGGLITLPSWASNWSRESLPALSSFLNPLQMANLADVAETIIPKTDTPGAKELGVDRFVEKMLADCFDKKAQENFSAGLNLLDSISQSTFGKPFSGLDKKQKQHVLTGMSMHQDPLQKNFFNTVKNLTVQGYSTSEYVMTNITNYELVPGRFHGCVPLKS